MTEPVHGCVCGCATYPLGLYAYNYNKEDTGY